MGLSTSLTNTFMCLGRKNELISCPEITVTLATSVSRWDLLPQFATARFTSISKHKRHDLASTTAHDCPQPTFVPSFLDKRPHLINFQDIFGLGRQECLFKFWTAPVFFLARQPVSDGSRRKCAGCRAYWNAPRRLTGFALLGLRCSRVSAPAHRDVRSPCTKTVDCHWHCDHS